MQQFGVQTTIQDPFVRRQHSLLMQAEREDLGVLIPRAIEDPTAAKPAHATHARKACGEKMELKMQRVRTHLIRPAIKTLEPRIVCVDTLERDLQTKTRRECMRQR